jgi:DeoR/GlpR family transcriptional regulator of sugar metabolism
MNQLFYHLIYNEKTKRWLKMLEQFEESQTVTGKDLATKLSCTQRTIQSDIKQIKQYFDSSILLLSISYGVYKKKTSSTRPRALVFLCRSVTCRVSENESGVGGNPQSVPS